MKLQFIPLHLLGIFCLYFWVSTDVKGDTLRLSSFIGGLPTEPAIDTAFIDSLFKDYFVPNPGASFIVIKEGNIVMSKAYGYADAENKVLATPYTNYRLASVSKQFTAMAIMILVHRGKLTYDTRLTDVFPEFPAYGQEINIRHLLTHRSGLADYGRFLEQDRTEQLLNREMLDSLMQTESTMFTPGSKFRYSNTAYALLPLIVEKLSGLSYTDFIHKEIFDPLEMNHSTTYYKGVDIENRAYGHVIEEGKVIKKDQSLTSALQGDGSIYTSVTEYAKWDQGLYNDKLMPQEELEEAFIAWDKNGKTRKKGYGYGWFISYKNGTKVLSHGGATIGFSLYVTRVPSKKLTVAVFSNRDQGDPNFKSISQALVSLFSDGEIPMPKEFR
ncbi:MAG: serine hydrolase domain-containing protein [Bacteroidota bacterium]